MRKITYSLFHAALRQLYGPDLCLASADKGMVRLTEAVARKLYAQGSFTPDLLGTEEARALTEATARRLYGAISVGLAPRQHASIDYVVDAAVQSALEQNAFIFSGFKTYHLLRELGLSLTTADGGLKPWDEFRESVLRLDAQYNQHYLRAEYNHAVAASQMASRWKQAEARGEGYDLQYRTAGDERVREEHAQLDGITLPMSDAFWGKYYPPNGWNCRCEAVQVRTGKYPRSDSAEAMRAGDACTALPKQQLFRYNPGKTLKVFPPKHPYLPKGCGTCPRRTELNLTRRDRGLPVCASCRFIAQQCYENQVQRLNEWKQGIDPVRGVEIAAPSLKTGKILVLRRSVTDTIGHTLNLDVLTSLFGIESGCQQWQYVGWAECTTQTRINRRTGIPETVRKHPEAAFFLYYKMEIHGRTYYANVKAHRHYQSEVLYCVRDRIGTVRTDEPPTNW